MKPGYKITIGDLEQRHNIAKFERDGVSRETLMKTMYKHTCGMKQSERTELVEKLFDRSEK